MDELERMNDRYSIMKEEERELSMHERRKEC